MPPRLGDILDLEVTKLAYGGRGVARVDDFVVFVRGALPGDRVRARVTKRKRRHAEARAVELLRPSAERITPDCRHAGECGGCEWQALTYERQLEAKQSQVVEALAHLGGLDDYALEPILGMSHPWRYRNKMEFSFGDDDGRLVLGLHRKGSWREIVEVGDCLLASERMNAARAAVAAAARELGLAAYDRGLRADPDPPPDAGTAAPDHAADGGLLRHLVVREGRASGDLLLHLYVRRRFPEEAALVQSVAARCPFTSFAVTVNDSPADAAVGDGPHMLAGPPFVRERLAGTDLRVPATAFLQTNTAMAEVLYETAAGFAGLAAHAGAAAAPGASAAAASSASPTAAPGVSPTAAPGASAAEADTADTGATGADAAARTTHDSAVGGHAVDLYCGIGSFSLRLARDAEHVTGIELQPEAIEAARVNAELNWAAHTAFFAGDVRRLLKDPSAVGLEPAAAPPEIVAVDPPRAGLAPKALQRAAALGAARFVYISCNPTTLAGNARELAELGYRLTRVRPVDMFPHTHHVETVALFVRDEG